MYYSNGEKVLYGGNHYEQDEKFKVEEGEKLVKVKVHSGVMVNGITFYTSTGRKIGPLGGPSASGREGPDDGPPPGSVSGYLTGIKGIVVHNRGDLAVRQLRFKWAYYDLTYYTQHSEQYENPSGVDLVSSA